MLIIIRQLRILHLFHELCHGIEIDGEIIPKLYIIIIDNHKEEVHLIGPIHILKSRDRSRKHASDTENL